jgi:hypothetical protein
MFNFSEVRLSDKFKGWYSRDPVGSEHVGISFIE